MAKIVTIDVRVTESAVFPLPRCTAKLETLPPGHEAIIINPKATLGIGPHSLINSIVSMGRMISCEPSPTITDFGYSTTRLKSEIFMSSAMPNMRKPMQIFMIMAVLEENSIRTIASMLFIFREIRRNIRFQWITKALVLILPPT